MALAAVAIGSLAAPDARARDPVEPGPELALRAALAIPAGQLSAHNDLSRSVSSAVPLIVEAGYRVRPEIVIGARFQYSPSDVRDAPEHCDGAASCWGRDVAVGAEGVYRPRPTARFIPWTGLVFGYEWFYFEYATVNAIQHSIGDGAVRGLQGGVQGGVEIRLSPHVTVGPFGEAQVGRYTHASLTTVQGTMTTSDGADITSTAWHEWFVLGVRGTLGL